MSPLPVSLDENATPEQVLLAGLMSEVAVCLIKEGSMAQVLQRVCEILVKRLDAAFARVWTLNAEDAVLELQASAGLYTHLDGPHSRVPVGEFKIGRIARSCQPHLSNDVPHDPEVSDQEWALREGMTSFAGYPLVVEGSVVGVVALFARRPLSESTLDALEAIAHGIALSIERKETEGKLLEKTELLQSVHRIGQLLTGELDLDRLLHTLTHAATELSEGSFGVFFANAARAQRPDCAPELELRATTGPVPACCPCLLEPAMPGRATLRLNDVRQSPAFHPVDEIEAAAYLFVPVVSEDNRLLGALLIVHPAPGKFRIADEEAVEALATQAAIAIGNATLFAAVEEEKRKLDAAASENERLLRHAELASRSKDEFLATVSHELRTPLTAILGWTNMLLHDLPLDDMARRGVEVIDRNARSQAQIVEDILDISRIISGKLRLDVRLMSPADVIEAAVESLRPAAAARNIHLHLVLDTGAGPISGDPERLQQVLWNLVSNAVKFTPKGGRVQVRLQRVNSQVEITVSDSGVGIDPGFLPHVFDRFRQADASSTRTHGGLGLGLAIVRQIVDLHGGTVSVSSPGINQGSTFVVSIPLAVVHRNFGRELEDQVHPEASDRRMPFVRPAQLKDLRVIVADDEEDTRTLLKFVLESCEAKVFAAADAQEAFEAIPRFSPAILISDIGMPHTDGYELIRRVRAREKQEHTRRLPAIALTAYTRVEDRMKVLASGFQMHVSKPVEPAELVTIVASLVDQSG